MEPVQTGSQAGRSCCVLFSGLPSAVPTGCMRAVGFVVTQHRQTVLSPLAQLHGSLALRVTVTSLFSRRLPRVQRAWRIRCCRRGVSLVGLCGAPPPSPAPLWGQQCCHVPSARHCPVALVPERCPGPALAAREPLWPSALLSAHLVARGACLPRRCPGSAPGLAGLCAVLPGRAQLRPAVLGHLSCP